MSDNNTSINPRQQILHSEDSEPTGRTVEMPQGIDDFTIVLPELTGMAACELKVYNGLDRLWRIVERYKMTAPIAIRVLDSKARCVRAIRGTRLAVKYSDSDGSCHLVSFDHPPQPIKSVVH